MSWKMLVVAMVALGSGPSLAAQDKQSEPFLGIWEINVTRTVNYPQQSQMMINVPAPGGGFISTRATIAKENKSSSSEIHPVAFDGKPHATTGGCARDRVQANRSVHDRTNPQSKRTHHRRYGAGLEGWQDADRDATGRRHANLRQEVQRQG